MNLLALASVLASIAAIASSAPVGSIKQEMYVGSFARESNDVGRIQRSSHQASVKGRTERYRSPKHDNHAAALGLWKMRDPCKVRFVRVGLPWCDITHWGGEDSDDVHGWW